MGIEQRKGLKVTFYQRKPRSNRNFSVENYFSAVRSALPANINYTLSICTYESSGFFKRLYNYDLIPFTDLKFDFCLWQLIHIFRLTLDLLHDGKTR